MTPEQKQLNEWIWKHDPIEPMMKPGRWDGVVAISAGVIGLVYVLWRLFW